MNLSIAQVANQNMPSLEDDINNEFEEMKSAGNKLRFAEYATDFLFAGSAGMCLGYIVVNELTYSNIFPTGYAFIMFCSTLLRGVEAYARTRHSSYMKFLENVQVVNDTEDAERNDLIFDKSGYEGWLNPDEREEW